MEIKNKFTLSSEIQQQIMSNRQEREEYLNKIFCLHSEQKDRCTKNETGQ
jgi:hypothetical protein